jgi:hypothetical protein
MLEQIERFANEVLPAFPAAVQIGRQWPNRLADRDALPMYHPDGIAQRGSLELVNAIESLIEDAPGQ